MSAVKPVPVPDAESAPIWKAAAEHVLALQRCRHCRQFTHPPEVVCRKCLAPVPAWDYVPLSGRGRIVTWTVFRQSFLPGFKADIPYAVVEAELEEQPGVRVLLRLVDGPDAKLALGMAVETVFEDVAPGVSLPRFKLAKSQGGRS